jgi:isoleucyl-tRNA synthetase
MYKKIDNSKNFTDREKDIVDFWRKNDIIKKKF